MANVTINIPDAIAADLVAALQEELGPEAAGFTARRTLVEWLKIQLPPRVKAYRLRGQMAALTAAETTAQTEKEQAYANARAARLAAEASINAGVNTELGGLA